MRLLAKRLRGTALDRALAALTSDNLETAVELAGLPDMVRGYEEIELANVTAYHRHLTETLTRLEAAVS